ncbi:MAG TPA: hypothetical protein PKK43_12065 [Spirochaetota bacterium]|nr:hypothetical protein [Spirochaetota bacterium]
MRTDEALSILRDKGVRESDLLEAVRYLKGKSVPDDILEDIVRIYSGSKNIELRYRIIKLLYDRKDGILKDMFMAAFKRERYLDMRICAIRGLANFLPEPEISKMMLKLIEILKKRKETTPYNYQEYEMLKGKNAIPFLVAKYGYASFREFNEVLNAQYEEMPDCFKNVFAVDEYGEAKVLRNDDAIDRFFENQRKNG